MIKIYVAEIKARLARVKQEEIKILIFAKKNFLQKVLLLLSFVSFCIFFCLKIAIFCLFYLLLPSWNNFEFNPSIFYTLSPLLLKSELNLQFLLELKNFKLSLTEIIIIIYNYFTGKLGEFYFTKGSQDQFCLQNIQSADKIGRWNPWLSKIFNFPKK